MPVTRTDSFLTPDDLEKELRSDVASGLSRSPKELPPKWFYDMHGSALFEEITRLTEYYPTRRERGILSTFSGEMARVSNASTLLELGAGAGEKTRILLNAMEELGTLRSYVPVDVSGEFLQDTAHRIAQDYPELAVHAVVADYDRHLHLLPSGERRMIALLGSTIGNMTPRGRCRFLGAVREIMNPEDTLLLGLDLVKPADRLVRAYDDAAGVTAEFNRNVLRVINDGLAADFDPSAFGHVAVWNAESEWVEMRLRSTRDQRVRIEALELDVTFAAGEEIRTEISAKFRRDGVVEELATAGLELVRWWVDAAEDFAVCLARPAGPAGAAAPAA